MLQPMSGRDGRARSGRPVVRMDRYNPDRSNRSVSSTRPVPVIALFRLETDAVRSGRSPFPGDQKASAQHLFHRRSSRGTAEIGSARWSGTARAGDVFFFNPYEVHSACCSGEDAEHATLCPALNSTVHSGRGYAFMPPLKTPAPAGSLPIPGGGSGGSRLRRRPRRARSGWRRLRRVPAPSLRAG